MSRGDAKKACIGTIDKLTGPIGSEQMASLDDRLAETKKRLEELKTQRRASEKSIRQKVKLTKQMRDRKIMLVGSAVMARVSRGEWDEAEFLEMMDEALSRPADRVLFDLDQ